MNWYWVVGMSWLVTSSNTVPSGASCWVSSDGVVVDDPEMSGTSVVLSAQLSTQSPWSWGAGLLPPCQMCQR